jgi:DNA polymerase-3 subunit delta'
VSWDEIGHQPRAIAILRRALSSGRTHHAYLFSGPDGVGKELAARVLAARLLCLADGLAPDADPCGTCESCRLLKADNHPDFHLVHRGLHKLHPDRSVRSSKGLFLAVDVVRHFLIEPSVNRPALSKRRVFVVRDAERMNEGAQNALLKTLEEPPGESCLILVTASADRLLQTIRSRCQIVPFGELPSDFVIERLQTIGRMQAGEAQMLAQLAQGRLGPALAWQRAEVLAALARIAGGVGEQLYRRPEAFGKALVEEATQLAQRLAGVPADEAEDDGADDAAAIDDDSEGEGEKRRGKTARTVDTDQLRDGLKLVLGLVAALYRDALVIASGGAAAQLLPAHARVTSGLAGGVPIARLSDAITAVAECERMLDRNVSPPLACERLATVLSGDLAPV